VIGYFLEGIFLFLYIKGLEQGRMIGAKMRKTGFIASQRARSVMVSQRRYRYT
jgi:hypothetical protein